MIQIVTNRMEIIPFENKVERKISFRQNLRFYFWSLNRWNCNVYLQFIILKGIDLKRKICCI